MTRPNICKEQSCNKQIREAHYLCLEHWREEQKGAINKCPQCGVYKDAESSFCIECDKKANAADRKNQKPSEDERKTRRYDSVRADTFDERAALLEDDPKAKDKRQLFDKQEHKCIYCGNVYQYDELQVEHMIPKALGGSDHIRNCQLACRCCNQAKGTMTDIEFRKKHAAYLPQQERTPAQPPIDPKKLQTSAPPPRPPSQRPEPERPRPPDPPEDSPSPKDDPNKPNWKRTLLRIGLALVATTAVMSPLILDTTEAPQVLPLSELASPEDPPAIPPSESALAEAPQVVLPPSDSASAKNLQATPLPSDSDTPENLPATLPLSDSASPEACGPFFSCKELRKHYPDGVRKGHCAYRAALDGDDDGHACEPYRR